MSSRRINLPGSGVHVVMTEPTTAEEVDRAVPCERKRSSNRGPVIARRRPHHARLSADRRLCDLSTMRPGELLKSDLARRAELVGTNHRLPTYECAEIDARHLLGASWAQRRMRDVASRIPDARDPTVAGQSAHLGTVERRTPAACRAVPLQELGRLGSAWKPTVGTASRWESTRRHPITRRDAIGGVGCLKPVNATHAISFAATGADRLLRASRSSPNRYRASASRAVVRSHPEPCRARIATGVHR
jgi:hypothetical protein